MKRITKEEYQALRNEINMRIQLMNTHNLGMITAVFAVWALVGVLFKNYADVMGSVNAMAITAYSYLIPFLTIIPLGIITPLSVKSGDNFGQIISISSYIKAYMELPCILDSLGNGEKSNEIMGWESIQDKEIKHKLSASFYNSEYFILSIIALVFFITVSVIIGCYAFGDNHNYLWLYLLIMTVMLVLGILATILVYTKSRSSKFIKRQGECYKGYCDFAVRSGMATQEEIDKVNKFLES